MRIEHRLSRVKPVATVSSRYYGTFADRFAIIPSCAGRYGLVRYEHKGVLLVTINKPGYMNECKSLSEFAVLSSQTNTRCIDRARLNGGVREDIAWQLDARSITVSKGNDARGKWQGFRSTVYCLRALLGLRCQEYAGSNSTVPARITFSVHGREVNARLKSG